MSLKYPEDKHIRISRSTKLRKYARVYKSYIRKTEQSNRYKSPRRQRVKVNNNSRIGDDKQPSQKHKSSKSRRKTLTAYQKFVQSESKKDKYKDFPGKERLSYIAAEWKQRKIKRNKKDSYKQ